MRLPTQKPSPTIAPWLCVLLCVGCGGRRFQSEPDAGYVGSGSQSSGESTVQPGPSNSSQPSEPFTSTGELSDCDGGTGCNSPSTTDSGQALAPGSTTTGDVVEGDAGDPNNTSNVEAPDVDAGPGDDSTDVSTSCAAPDCATSSSIVTSNGSTTTDTSTSPASTVSEDTSTAPFDECPEHDDQVERGSCGCGFVASVECETLAAHVVHRYPFDGEGTQLLDVAAGANGEIHNCKLNATSQLELDGEDCYVALPSGLLSGYSDATLELWVRWNGGGNNQRIFNFGTAEDDGDTPSSFISLSPRAGSDDELTLSYLADPDDSSETLRTDYALGTGSLEHLAVVVDSSQGRLSLYRGGQLQTSMDTYQDLTELEDESVWLGRALYSEYPYFHGQLLEFRIYDTALGETELGQSAALGPDAHFDVAQ